MPMLANPAQQELISFQTGLKKQGNNFKERKRMFSMKRKVRVYRHACD